MELLLKQIRCALAPRKGQHRSPGGTAGGTYTSARLLWRRGALLPSQQRAQRAALPHSVHKGNCSTGERERETWALTGVFFFLFNHLLGLPSYPFHCTRTDIRRYITACMHISIQSRGGGQFVRSLYIPGARVRQRLTCGRKKKKKYNPSVQN